MHTSSTINVYIAEGLGTYLLVFSGTAAIVANDVTGGKLTDAGVALAFGLSVAAAIRLFSQTSGALAQAFGAVLAVFGRCCS
ncbi:MAG: aquaporin [Nitrospiria bacterium]